MTVDLRVVDDVDTLKAMSDPVRLAILRVLMTDARREPRVRTVKELAEELGEPQTKLYRHIKQLEARGLIEVAETRMVSGILEHRYRTGQISLRMESSFLAGDQVGLSDTIDVFVAGFDDFRDSYIEALNSGQVRFSASYPEDAPYLRPILVTAEDTIPAAKAAEFHTRLRALIAELTETEHDDDGVPVRVCVAFFSPAG